MDITYITEEQKKYCRRCGRQLKDTQSKELGFGRTCYKKHVLELMTKRKPLFPITKRTEVLEVTSYEINI